MQYVHSGNVITTIPDTSVSAPIMIVADEVMQDIVNRLDTLEQTVAGDIIPSGIRNTT